VKSRKSFKTIFWSLAGNSNIYDKKNKPVEEFENEQWMYDLAFLTDISAHLN